MKTLTDIIGLAEKLPSGLNDGESAEKLLKEKREFLDALAAGDVVGALTEAADAAYYVAKYLEWVARQLQAAGCPVSVQDVLQIAVVKYALRAQPGNPKDDAREREAVQRFLKNALNEQETST